MAEKENSSLAGRTPATSGAGSSDNSVAEVTNGYGSNDDHVFTDGKTVAYWRTIYENASYEGRHRFDPTYKWTAQEELKLLRKVSTIVSVYLLTSPLTIE